MRLLLDTHIALWAITDSPRLNAQARSLILDPANSIHISSVSVWEIAIKHMLGRGGMPIRHASRRPFSGSGLYGASGCQCAHCHARNPATPPHGPVRPLAGGASTRRTAQAFDPRRHCQPVQRQHHSGVRRSGDCSVTRQGNSADTKVKQRGLGFRGRPPLHIILVVECRALLCRFGYAIPNHTAAARFTRTMVTKNLPDFFPFYGHDFIDLNLANRVQAAFNSRLKSDSNHRCAYDLLH